MNIDVFLNEMIVDFFCNMMEFEGLSEEEREQKLMSVDGLEAEDKEVVANNIEEIDVEHIQDEVYAFAKETHHESGISAPNLVKFLAQKMFIYHYDDKDKALVNYLRNVSIDDLIDFFEENDDFGRAMISAFINTEVYEEEYEETIEKIKITDSETMEKFKLDPPEIKITTLNDFLRNIICNLYNHYIENGCDDITALNNVWAYFFRDFDPLGELDKMGIDLRSKNFYKKYMINLMYADLYEDVSNEAIRKGPDYEDRLALSIPLITTHIGLISLPKEEGVRNRILKHFILLQDEQEKKKQNRKKTHVDGRIHILKKVNPTYILDELTLGFSKHF